jgi:hypothetical protein
MRDFTKELFLTTLLMTSGLMLNGENEALASNGSVTQSQSSPFRGTSQARQQAVQSKNTPSSPPQSFVKFKPDFSRMPYPRDREQDIKLQQRIKSLVGGGTLVTEKHLQAAKKLIKVRQMSPENNYAQMQAMDFWAAMKLFELNKENLADNDFRRYLDAVKKLLKGHAPDRLPIAYRTITATHVEAMVLLNTNLDGRFDGLNDGTNADVTFSQTTTFDEPSSSLLGVATYLLDKGFNQFGADEIIAYYYLSQLKEANIGAPIPEPTAEQIRVVADVNKTVNNSQDFTPHDKANYKREVIWRIRETHGKEIPAALAVLTGIIPFSGKGGTVNLVEFQILWQKEGSSAFSDRVDDSGRFLVLLPDLQGMQLNKLTPVTFMGLQDKPDNGYSLVLIGAKQRPSGQ